ncbi:MAG: Permease of the drug/metabolite transporter superfamily, partial [Adhaeribacter sp.]|nr:Permease of the drug/metabolite transporter superfamily [Adhaeribacter sp.]
EQANKPFVRAALVKNDGFQAALGRPNRETVITGRDSQANLLQALELTNGKAFNQVLKKGAASWIARYKQNDQIIREVYRNALGRPPLPREFAVAKQVLGESPDPEAVQDFLWAIVLLPEFQLIY